MPKDVQNISFTIYERKDFISLYPVKIISKALLELFKSSPFNIYIFLLDIFKLFEICPFVNLDFYYIYNSINHYIKGEHNFLTGINRKILSKTFIFDFLEIFKIKTVIT